MCHQTMLSGYSLQSLGCCAGPCLPRRRLLHDLLLAAQSWKTALSWCQPTCFIQQMPTLHADMLKWACPILGWLPKPLGEQWKVLESSISVKSGGSSRGAGQGTTNPRSQSSHTCTQASGACADLDYQKLIDCRGLIACVASVVAELGMPAGT
jgi:hypothetical protein